MTLEEVLATASSDDAVALSYAKSYPVTVGKLIPRTTMNSLLAQFGLFTAFEAEAKTDDRFAAFMHTTSNEYNFMVGTTAGDAQLGMLDTIITEGRFPNLAALKGTVVAIANATTYPFAAATMEQLKAIRYPATWQPITLQGADKVVLLEGDALLSTSNKGGFRFVLTPAENFTGNAEIRVFAKRATEDTFVLQSNYTMSVHRDWVAGQPVSHVFGRPAGLSGYRHFRFEVRAPFANAMTEVKAEGIA